MNTTKTKTIFYKVVEFFGVDFLFFVFLFFCSLVCLFIVILAN